MWGVDWRPLIQNRAQRRAVVISVRGKKKKQKFLVTCATISFWKIFPAKNLLYSLDHSSNHEIHKIDFLCSTLYALSSIVLVEAVLAGNDNKVFTELLLYSSRFPTSHCMCGRAIKVCV